MGQIINVSDGGKSLPAPLTETVKSGFRSGGYLADGPAIDAVADDETVQYVLTNRKQGIAIQRDTTRHVIPDSRYETVVVVTDRRVIALVGKVGGDQQFSLDISALTDVVATTDRRTGRLILTRDDGPTWSIQTEADGLAEVAEYLREKRDTCQATGRTRTAIQPIRDLFETTKDTARAFERNWVAELIPALDEPLAGRAERTDSSGETPEESSTGSSTDSDEPDSGVTRRSDKPDTETAIDEILRGLAKTDWRARGAQPEGPFDLLAERADELVGVVVHCPEDGRLDRETIRRCDAIAGAAGTDTVLLATTGTIREADARLATELGVRLRTVATLSDATDPPTIETVTEMVTEVLSTAGWSVRPEATGPFDLLAECGGELLGVVVHSPEDSTVRSSIEQCDAVTGAAGTDTVLLATMGTVRETDERLADELGVRLVASDSLGQCHVTEIDRE